MTPLFSLAALPSATTTIASPEPLRASVVIVPADIIGSVESLFVVAFVPAFELVGWLQRTTVHTHPSAPTVHPA